MVKEKTPVNKPCPFCGSKDRIDTINYASGDPAKFRVQCQDCGDTTKWHDTEDDAWKAWNSRDFRYLENIFVCKDLFVFKGCIHVRNPQTQFCYIDGLNGYKRMKKGDYLKAYAECAKVEGKAQV
jgi:Lar family restriction alleviation protein